MLATKVARQSQVHDEFAALVLPADPVLQLCHVLGRGPILMMDRTQLPKVMFAEARFASNDCVSTGTCCNKADRTDHSVDIRRSFCTAFIGSASATNRRSPVVTTAPNLFHSPPPKERQYNSAG